MKGFEYSDHEFLVFKEKPFSNIFQCSCFLCAFQFLPNHPNNLELWTDVFCHKISNTSRYFQSGSSHSIQERSCLVSIWNVQRLSIMDVKWPCLIMEKSSVTWKHQHGAPDLPSLVKLQFQLPRQNLVDLIWFFYYFFLFGKVQTTTLFGKIVTGILLPFWSFLEEWDPIWTTSSLSFSSHPSKFLHLLKNHEMSILQIVR